MSAPSPPATLVAQRLSLLRGDRRVLVDVSLTIPPAARIGVVGPNGVGKTSLLQILAGALELQAGRVRLEPPTASVGLLAQEPRHRPGETVRGHLARRTGVASAEGELLQAASALEGGGAGSSQRYEAALERFVALSDGDFDARVETVLGEMGIPGVVDQVVDQLSGGQASKVALAAIVLSRFDITLLDEPTNNLDFEGLDRLRDFVRDRRGGVVVVSHDREFLRETVSSVLEIDGHAHTAKLFNGGWDAYLAERALDRLHAEEAYRLYNTQRSELLARARRERDWATHGVAREKKGQRDNDKAQRDFRINRTEQLASKARRTERALQALEVVDKPWEGWQLQFRIENAPRSGAVVARLSAAVIERGSFRLGPLDLEIGYAERVALVGPNGCGKSSLVAAVLGRLPLASGDHWLGPGVIVGELSQDRSPSGADRPLVERVTARCGVTTTEARSLLAKFGLGADHVERPAWSLSAGERTRGELAMFQGLGVNFLVLDEPTNHLDLPAIEQLEAALAEFHGTLLVVSHDRQLLASVELTRRLDVAHAGQLV